MITPGGPGTVELVAGISALIKLDTNPLPNITIADMGRLWFRLEELRDEEAPP